MSALYVDTVSTTHAFRYSDAWRELFGLVLAPKGIEALDGLEADAASLVLDAVLCVPLPRERWASDEGAAALAWLRGVRDVCRAHPEGIVRLREA